MVNVAAFKRCLPALQQIAVFPGCDRGYVCRKRFLERNDVDATLAACLAQFNRKIWNEDALREAAAHFSVELVDLSTRRESPPPDAEPAAAGSALQVLERPRIAARPREQVTPLAPATKATPRARVPLTPSYLKVCTLLLENPGMKETAACRQVGVQQGSWSYFKMKHFELGRPIASDELRKVLTAMAGEIREPKAAAAVVVEMVPSISVGKKSDGKMDGGSAESDSRDLENGVSDVERRRLVATITGGLLAQSDLNHTVPSAVAMGFEIFDSLVAHDRARLAKARRASA